MEFFITILASFVSKEQWSSWFEDNTSIYENKANKFQHKMRRAVQQKHKNSKHLNTLIGKSHSFGSDVHKSWAARHSEKGSVWSM